MTPASVDWLRDMALFVEVAKVKSFSVAAEHLGMPPSTLSRRISGLEKQLGLRLLKRTTRRVEVTDVGATYYARCAQIVEEARWAHEQLQGDTATARGTLRLSCSGDFSNQYLAPVLVEFSRRHPEVRVEIDLTARLADLTTENLDAALRIGPLPDSSMVARKITDLRSSLYASPTYAATAPALDVPLDLTQHECIGLASPSSGDHWHLVPAGNRLRKPPGRVKINGKFRVNSVFLIRDLTLMGAGIGKLDPSLAEPLVRAGQLIRMLPDWEFAPTPVHLLTASRLMPLRVRLFGDLLCEMLPPSAG